jgi:hypothetical protein
MKTLTKAQEDYILNNFDKLSVSELANDTGCSLPTIRAKVKILKKNVVVKEQQKVEESKPIQQIRKPDTPIMSAFGRSDKKQATIMTPGAAAMCDDTKSKNIKKKKEQKHIHKPFGG